MVVPLDCYETIVNFMLVMDAPINKFDRKTNATI